MARDDALLGVAGGLSIGRFVVIVAIITGLLLATPFVAQVCYGPV